MTVEMTAIIQTNIEDLGVILAENEFINLLDNFDKEDLLQSTDLETAINSVDVTIAVDGEVVNYNEFIQKISNLTKHEHYNLNQIQHNLYTENYFKVTKENGKSKFITYYTDNNMTSKVQEDEIVRDVEGKVSEIVTRTYESGVVIQEMSQLLNRDAEGKVESITTNTQ